MDVVPGVGIDFTEVGQVLALVGLYLGSALVSWAAAIPAQQHRAGRVRPSCATMSSARSTGFRCATSTPRRAVICSARVTNDIDNVSQSLQQTLSQLVIAVLSVIGILAMMIVISPLLA